MTVADRHNSIEDVRAIRRPIQKFSPMFPQFVEDCEGQGDREGLGELDAAHIGSLPSPGTRAYRQAAERKRMAQAALAK